MRSLLLKISNAIISLVLTAAIFTIVAFAAAAAWVAFTHFVDLLRSA